MFWEQNADRSHSIKTDVISFERLEDIKYLGKKTHQNSIQDYIKTDWSQEMLATIRCRTFVLLFAIQKFKDQGT